MFNLFMILYRRKLQDVTWVYTIFSL